MRELVAAGRASSVSGFVQHAVRVALFDAAGWRSMLDEALSQSGGPLTQKERALADALLSPAEEKPTLAQNQVRPTQGGMSRITFDAGGLIALDRKDRRVLARWPGP